MRKKQSIRIFFVASIMMAAVMLWGANVSVFAKETKEEVIPLNVYIGDVSVGGMTADEAREAVADYVKDVTDVDVVLKAGQKSVTVKADNVSYTGTVKKQ